MSIIKDILCHDIIIGKPTKINKVIYSKEIVNNIINELESVELYGTLDNPEKIYELDPSKIAFKLNNISIRKRKLLFNITILDTEAGIKLQSIIDDFNIKTIFGIKIDNNKFVQQASLIALYTQFKKPKGL